MSSRGSNKKDNSSSQSSKNAPARQSQFFVNGAGIDREVITTDICRYLGNDALVRPSTHKDPKTGQVQEGFLITAYRAPTTAQLADLRADSLKWQREREREKNSSGARGGYPNSITRQEIWGGNLDEPQQPVGGYTQQQGYGQMPQPQPTQNPPRGNEYMGGRGSGYPTMNMASMAPPVAPGGYRPEAYAQQGQQQNYTTSYTPQAPPIGQVSYSVGIDSNRETRMDTAPRNMPPGTAYPPSGMPLVQSGYGQGRGASSYYAPATGQPMATGYHPESQGAYPDPYGRPDSGTPQDEPPPDFYTNDEEPMDYEETPPQGQAQQQRRGDRDRDRDRERERDRDHDAPRKHRDRHR